MADPYKRDMRRGRFYLSRPMIEDLPGLRRAIQADVELIDVRNDFMRDRQEWFAISPHFDIVESGEEIPLYRWTYREAKETVSWERTSPTEPCEVVVVLTRREGSQEDDTSEHLGRFQNG